MNLGFFREILSRNEKIKVIGKNAEVDGVICNVMGIVRDVEGMRLLILIYDEIYRQKVEESELAQLSEYPSRPETNRMMLSRDRIDVNNPFKSVSKVFIGKREFKINGTHYRRLNVQDWEPLLIIAKFLNNGWQPNGIDYQNIDMLFLTSLKIEGKYDFIPDFNHNPELRFVNGPSHVVHQVEKPVTLVVGDNPEKLVFQDAETGTEHWVQINRVYLTDIWDDMDKIFSNPRLLKQMTPEQINRARLDFEKKFSEVCPKGMYLPVIEYECEEDISLEFYTKSFLDAKPSNTSSSIGFIYRPDQPTGILGLKLKAAVIQEPVPKDTNIIEAELFQYIETTDSRDFILK